MPALNLLIKPSPGMCNLNCTYCFYHDPMSKREIPSYGFMSKKIQETLIKKALDYTAGQCSFGFQEGEPTMTGLEFYKKFVELIRQYNHKNLDVNFYVQANGYQLSQEWIKFLARHHFLTGISLDDTIHTYNRYRKNYDGKDSFAQVMETTELFDRYKAKYNILTVVNQAAAMSVKKIYQFYRKNDFRYPQFIPYLNPIGKEGGNEGYSLLLKAYGESLCELFGLQYDDYFHGRIVPTRTFDNYLGILRGYPPEACDMRGQCNIQHAVEVDGSAYPYDSHVLDQQRLGNVMEDDLADYRAREKAKEFIKNSHSIDEGCQNCRYFPLCRGECRRVREESVSGKNYFCWSCKMSFDYTLNRMERMR